MKSKADDLTKLYKLRFNDEELERKYEIWRVLVNDFFTKIIPENSHVLDLASGSGEFINNFPSPLKHAIDMNPESAKYLHSEIKFSNVSATDLADVISAPVDAIFTSNFLEHLRDKSELETVLNGAFSALKPGGKLVILGPNLRYLPGQYWDFYDHHLGLTDKSLVEILGLTGFQIERSIPRFLPYTTKGVLPTHPVLVKIYLRFPLLWPILGRQFLIAALKPKIQQPHEQF